MSIKFRSDGFKYMGKEIPNHSLGFSVHLFEDGVMEALVHSSLGFWKSAIDKEWGEKRYDSHTFQPHYIWWFPVTRNRGQMYIDNDNWSDFVNSFLSKKEFDIRTLIDNLYEHFNWYPPTFFEEIEL